MLNIINVLKYSCSNLCYFGKVSVLFSMVFPMISYSQQKKSMIILYNQRNSYMALAAHAKGDYNYIWNCDHEEWNWHLLIEMQLFQNGSNNNNL
jgi:hypothetical protein